ncbi:MAG: hypothetical protein ACLFTB_06995 [Desulfovibrionales bacterium]
MSDSVIEVRNLGHKYGTRPWNSRCPKARSWLCWAKTAWNTRLLRHHLPLLVSGLFGLIASYLAFEE